MAPYGASSIQSIFSPAVLQGSWGPLRFYLHFQARPLALALVVFSSRSFDGCYLTRWRSFAVLLAGSSASGTSRTKAPHDAVDRADDISSLWQMTVGFPFNLVTSTSRLASLGCCSGSALLALLRPVVPHTLALSGALSAGGVSSSGTLQRSSLPTDCPPSSSCG